MTPFVKGNPDCELVKENYMTRAGLTNCDLPHGLKTKIDLCANLSVGKMSQYRRISRLRALGKVFVSTQFTTGEVFTWLVSMTRCHHLF